MTLRSLALLLLVPALVLAVVACGGDDDDSGGDNGSPDATEVADGNGDDAGDDDGGDDDDGDPGDDDGGSAGSRGSGTVVRGDITYEIAMDSCIVDPDGESFIIGGTTTGADGQPAYFAAEGDEPFGLVNVDLGIGSTSYFDVERGDEHYETAGYASDAEFIPPYITEPDLVVEVNGGVHVSFTAPVDPFDEVEDDLWTVEVSCE